MPVARPARGPWHRRQVGRSQRPVTADLLEDGVALIQHPREVLDSGVEVDAFYLTNWQFSAKYAWYFGNDEPEDRTLDDRDNFAISVKYVF